MGASGCSRMGRASFTETATYDKGLERKGAGASPLLVPGQWLLQGQLESKEERGRGRFWCRRPVQGSERRSDPPWFHCKGFPLLLCREEGREVQAEVRLVRRLLPPSRANKLGQSASSERRPIREVFEGGISMFWGEGDATCGSNSERLGRVHPK